MHPDEWTARLELAACYRVFAHLGWTEMIYNHITLRPTECVSTGGKRPAAGRDLFDALVRQVNRLDASYGA
jgi:ribulose-5-phosphate 4-epimerase/fuculose-1-phosphate aldolase